MNLSETHKFEGRILCQSHVHPLKKHPNKHHNGWRCDKIKGVNRCLSGITDFYQVDSINPPISGYRCDQCDFDLCERCVKADIFVENVILDRED